MYAIQQRILNSVSLLVFFKIFVGAAFAESRTTSFTPSQLEAKSNALIIRMDDKEFEFVLTPSTSFTAVKGERDGTPLSLPGLHFMGQLVNDPNSWIRLSYISYAQEPVFLGALLVNNQFYLIERGEDFGGGIKGQTYLTPINQGRGGILLRDWPQGVSSEQLEFASAKVSQANWQNSVPKALPMSVVVDDAYDRTYQGLGVFRALNAINVVDGIYRTELGLGIHLQKVQLVSNIGSVEFKQKPSLEKLLLEFAEYRRTQGQNMLGSGVVHLFSGEKDSLGRVGLAYNNTACSAAGWDVGVSLPFARAGLIAAHEVAHNLGATHDDEADTLCKDAQSLMSARLDDGLGYQLSSCGIKQIAPAVNRECVRDQRDIRLNASLNASTNTARVVINNQSPYASQTQIVVSAEGLSLDLSGMSCRANEASQMVCHVREIPAYSERVLELPMLEADQAAQSHQVEQALLAVQLTDGVDFASADNQIYIRRNGQVVRANPDVVAPQAFVAENNGSQGGGAGGGQWMGGVLGYFLFSIFGATHRRQGVGR